MHINISIPLGQSRIHSPTALFIDPLLKEVSFPNHSTLNSDKLIPDITHAQRMPPPPNPTPLLLSLCRQCKNLLSKLASEFRN